MAETMSTFFTMEERDKALPLRVAGVGLGCAQNLINREKGYDHFHLFRCSGGRGRVEAAGRSFTLGENMAMILYPHEPHRYYPEESPWRVDWITFDCTGGPALMGYLGFGRSDAMALTMPELLAADLREMAEIIRGPRPAVKMALSSQLYRALVDLSRSVPDGGADVRGTPYKKLEPVLRYIELNYRRPLTLPLLAAQAGVSPQHLCLLFRQVLHVRPFRYVNSLRINKSRRLLLDDKERAVSDIAADCGFENICYFNQTFRQITGMSPSAFRAMH